MFKQYLTLTKPGIIFGNVITAFGGFFLASKGTFYPIQFIGMLIGVVTIIASACVFNNCIDKDIDFIMKRTQKRPTVTGLISVKNALIFAILLLVVSLLILYFLTTKAAMISAFLGFFVYVVLYSLYFKRQSIHGTLIGSFSGAFPPVIGYLSVHGEVNSAVFVLFAMFSFWQMPHSYAIALFRGDDYKNANIPVLPLLRSRTNTLWQILSYSILFFITATLLTFLGYANWLYLIVITLLSLYWIYIEIKGFGIKDSEDFKKWARKVFFISIFIVLIASFTISIESFLLN